ncbi:MAG: SpoIVB peptidase [Halanaerobiales bacterium]
MTGKNTAYLIISLIIIGLILSYYNICQELPNNMSLLKDSESILELSLPFGVYVRENNFDNKDVLSINGKKLNNNYRKFTANDSLSLEAREIGQTVLDFRIFGIIPLRTLKINVIPEIEVQPGGQAIGVLMKSKGVMVVGISSVIGDDGQKYFPAKDAGINIGDRIIAINGERINEKFKLASLLQEVGIDGGEIKLKIVRAGDGIKEIEISPVRDHQGMYLIGLYVDDSVAGVGTLTFHRPDSREFGALGHLITETHSQTKIEIREGKIVNANISGINTGQKGIPGEKMGTFFESKDQLGKIINNSEYGIFGILEGELEDNPYFSQPIPVAAISSIKRGPAKMYTVIRGGEIEEFNINIERVFYQSKPEDKGLIIDIVDPELEQSTGGIVQGMSGSPIVQDDKLVGAVTHVFVNNPTRGYGVFAEWMLLQTETYKKAS